MPAESRESDHLRPHSSAQAPSNGEQQVAHQYPQAEQNRQLVEAYVKTASSLQCDILPSVPAWMSSREVSRQVMVK